MPWDILLRLPRGDAAPGRSLKTYLLWALYLRSGWILKPSIQPPLQASSSLSACSIQQARAGASSSERSLIQQDHPGHPAPRPVWGFGLSSEGVLEAPEPPPAQRLEQQNERKCTSSSEPGGGSFAVSFRWSVAGRLPARSLPGVGSRGVREIWFQLERSRIPASRVCRETSPHALVPIGGEGAEADRGRGGGLLLRCPSRSSCQRKFA